MLTVQSEKAKADFPMFIFPFICQHSCLLSTPENNSNCRHQGQLQFQIVIILKTVNSQWTIPDLQTKLETDYNVDLKLQQLGRKYQDDTESL